VTLKYAHNVLMSDAQHGDTLGSRGEPTPEEEQTTQEEQDHEHRLPEGRQRWDWWGCGLRCNRNSIQAGYRWANTRHDAGRDVNSAEGPLPRLLTSTTDHRSIKRSRERVELHTVRPRYLSPKVRGIIQRNDRGGGTRELIDRVQL